MKDYNGVMMQFFHWYTPADGSLWKQLAEQAASLSQAGITSLWLPPAYKGAAGADDSGYAFGEQNDYFDQQNCIGWTSTGNAEHPGGMAVLLSNDADSAKSMNTGSPGVTYEDVTEHIKETVTTNGEGWAEFRCKGRSVSVWVPVDES